jgi:hypothetical protein
VKRNVEKSGKPLKRPINQPELIMQGASATSNDSRRGGRSDNKIRDITDPQPSAVCNDVHLGKMLIDLSRNDTGRQTLPQYDDGGREDFWSDGRSRNNINRQRQTLAPYDDGRRKEPWLDNTIRKDKDLQTLTQSNDGRLTPPSWTEDTNRNDKDRQPLPEYDDGHDRNLWSGRITRYNIDHQIFPNYNDGRRGDSWSDIVDDQYSPKYDDCRPGESSEDIGLDDIGPQTIPKYDDGHHGFRPDDSRPVDMQGIDRYKTRSEGIRRHDSLNDKRGSGRERRR